MGLYLLNISVDSADIKPDHIPEDLSFNDQESIVEIVVEKLMGFENAIDEYDDRDTEDHNTKDSLKIDFLVYLASSQKPSYDRSMADRQKFMDCEARLNNGYLEIDSPPPKT